jgi:hypothetical protein
VVSGTVVDVVLVEVVLVVTTDVVVATGSVVQDTATSAQASIKPTLRSCATLLKMPPQDPLPALLIADSDT